MWGQQRGSERFANTQTFFSSSINGLLAMIRDISTTRKI
jgi:hypothetical protein